MFRSHTDMIRTPIEVEKVKAAPKSNKATSDGYNCDICGQPWLTETDVEIHRKKAHLAELITLIRNQKHFCLICVRGQGSAENLHTHIKTNHLLSSPSAQRIEREIFICDICENIFFNKRLLISHIQYTHSNESSDVIQCPKCPKSFDKKKIWFHFTFHQLNISSTCQICLTVCKSKSELVEHLKSHPAYYVCEICDYTRNKKNFYDEHIEMHRKRHPYNLKGDLRRYFAPSCPAGQWKYRVNSGIKGLQMYEFSICILCREICMSAAEKKRHMLVDHAPQIEVKQKPMCYCGEEFFNMVLLKHHVFKMKGDHRLLEENEMPKVDVQALFEDPNDSHAESVENETPSPTVEKEESFENPTEKPMDCELFTVEDLGPMEVEVIVKN